MSSEHSKQLPDYEAYLRSHAMGMSIEQPSRRKVTEEEAIATLAVFIFVAGFLSISGQVVL